MKTLNDVTKLCTLFLASLCVLVFSNSASAAAYRKWCTTWTTTYTDAGYGEDYLNSRTPNIQRPARYTRAILWDNTGSQNNNIWSGFLDENGCTPYKTLFASRTYYLKQLTYAANGTREILVNPNGSPNWNNDAVSITFSEPVYSVVDGTYDQFTFNNLWVNSKANIMGVAGEILRYPSKTGFPVNTRLRYKTDQVGVCFQAGAYTYGGTDICIIPGMAWVDSSKWKYVVTHEAGHAIAAASQSVRPSGYYNDYYYYTPPLSLCSCHHIGNYGTPEDYDNPQNNGTGYGTHCLQSKESIENAQGEGFAHFAATAVMNTRTYKDGVFINPKPAFGVNPEPGLFVEVPPPFIVLAYRGTQFLNPDDKWLDRRCDGSNQPGAGVELDWLRFFFEIWTHGSSVYSADDIHYIWRTAGSNVSWANLQNVVNAKWGTGSDKANWFDFHGGYTGVSPD